MNEQYAGQKKEFLKHILKKDPSMRLHYVNKPNSESWGKDKLTTVTNITEEGKKTVNLRRTFKDEVLIDIEEKWRLNEIQQKLKDYNWSYELYETGSRGFHVSILFNNLSKLDQELRQRIRKFIISEFNADERLASENQWIALEWACHMKTGKEKILIDTINLNIPNVIDGEIVNYCLQDLEKKKQLQKENIEIIKDYVNDPYLKYVMENTIERGDRNNILFKNLAIGLVQGGLSREQIIPYAQKIISNCPGKTTGEFMGWVDKSLSGQLSEYNRSEILSWAKKYDYPILYKMYGDEELLDFLDVKQLWDEIWDNKIAEQNVWRDMCFYNLMGTILREKDWDLRVHLIFSSYSSSGKDEGINLVQEILDRLGYKTRIPGDVTDRTLVGSYNPTIVEYNSKNELTEENPTKGNKKYRDPIEKGWLDSEEWIAFPECEVVLKPGVHNKKIQLILRQAMDEKRIVEKGVGGFTIPIKTNTSFILTTYKMNDTVNAVLHNGLFQRSLFYNRELSDTDHKSIRQKITMNRFSKKENPFNKEKYIMKLIHKLKDIRNWYNENKKEMDYEKDSDKVVNYFWDSIEEQHSDFVVVDKEVLNSMVRRLGNSLYKLSILTAVSKKSNLVTHDMIRTCSKLIEICISSIRTLVLTQDTNKKRHYVILQTISNGSISKSSLYTIMQKKLKIKHLNNCVSLLKKLIDTQYISSFKSGRSDMLTLTDKGRSYLEYEK